MGTPAIYHDGELYVPEVTSRGAGPDWSVMSWQDAIAMIGGMSVAQAPLGPGWYLLARLSEGEPRWYHIGSAQPALKDYPDDEVPF